MRTASFALLLALAACAPEMSTASVPIAVDPGCASNSLQIYPGTNFTGTPLCLVGTGVYHFTRTFTPNSYQPGDNDGCFRDGARFDVRFHPWFSVADASPAVENAMSVEIGSVAPGSDAWSSGCQP